MHFIGTEMKYRTAENGSVLDSISPSLPLYLSSSISLFITIVIDGCFVFLDSCVPSVPSFGRSLVQSFNRFYSMLMLSLTILTLCFALFGCMFFCIFAKNAPTTTIWESIGNQFNVRSFRVIFTTLNRNRKWLKHVALLARKVVNP